MLPLDGIHVVSLALNLPGPLAVAQLRRLGASVVKIEPPAGDALGHALPEWYQQLHQGVQIVTLDIKQPTDRERLESYLGQADLLLTAMRPAALERLGLAWPTLHVRHQRLCHVAIVGYPPPREEQPGHDLTFQAVAGLLEPPHMPRACIADFAGAERVVSTALALLLARERGQSAQCVHVALAEVAEGFAAPLRYGLTSPHGVLGGAHAGYNLYQTHDGWIALAALEPHFWQILTAELGLPISAGRDELEQAFRAKTAADWEARATACGLPLVVVR